MPTHFEGADFEQNFPDAADLFPEAVDNENYLDAIFFNSLAASLLAIEGYLITWKANIEAEAMDSFSGADGEITFDVPAGIYPEGKTATAQDGDLVAGNIKKDVVVFGVTGTLEAVAAGLIGVSLPANDVLSETPVVIAPTGLSIVAAMPGVGVPSVTSP
jgi:hypothetical protein